MLRKSKISFWNDELEKNLSDTFGDEKHLIEYDVNSGRAIAWKLNDGQAYMVTRSEGTELVIMCFQGQGFLALQKQVVQWAISLGYKTMRFHTPDKRLLHVASRVGAKFIEYVARIDLDEQRRQYSDNTNNQTG